MKNQQRKSKATRNYYVDISAFLPFLFLLITGIVMLVYHKGRPYSDEILRMNRDSWLFLHKIFTVITIPMTTIHLILHFDWLKKLVKGKLNNKHRGVNFCLFTFFFITALTSVFLKDDEIAGRLCRVHSKCGIVLILLFLIHIMNYFNWLVGMTRKVLYKS